MDAISDCQWQAGAVGAGHNGRKGKRLDLHLANYVLGGWQLAGIHNYLSGAPIAVGSSGLNVPAGFGSIRPDVLSSNVALGDVPSKTDVTAPVQWLNPAAFANVPTTGNGLPLRVGTAPRNLDYLRGPAGLSESFRMSKAFPFIHEKATFKVGMTMTNPSSGHRHILLTEPQAIPLLARSSRAEAAAPCSWTLASTSSRVSNLPEASIRSRPPVPYIRRASADHTEEGSRAITRGSPLLAFECYAD